MGNTWPPCGHSKTSDDDEKKPVQAVPVSDEPHVRGAALSYDASEFAPEDDGGVDIGRLCKMGCGKPVQPGTTRRGNPYDTCCRSCVINPGLGFHDATCGGSCASDDAPPPRPACPKGARCHDRSEEHLAAEAHPLDQDYALACAKSSLTPEPLSLKVIFDWADADGSGKLDRAELMATFSVLKAICHDHLPDISDEAWAALDEDGNGVLNFMEFASWAGPRLGLPLGMERMLHRASSVGKSMPCQVIGCPCECWDGPADAGKKRKCACCKHKKGSHKFLDIETMEEVPFPDYWSNRSGEFNQVIALGEDKVEQFQRVFEKTYLKKWTRDRTKHNPARPAVPSGFQVVAVRRNENAKTWREYACKRAELLHRLNEEAEEGQDLDKYPDVKTMVAFGEVANYTKDRLAHDCNEWYLFHGTHREAAQKIMASDFRVACAGANTGTLYGKGLYFAESITKSDEYAKPDADGNYAMLVCRVLGGRVRYTDENEPNPEELVQSCISGPYDCVLGDREKCRGTFREFVLFDSEDVYPEFEILYKRLY